jgi:hypothetical protein
MASLGQLTAGIAHEIKNPLNFVNNFAGLSVELLDELKETAAPERGGRYGVAIPIQKQQRTRFNRPMITRFWGKRLQILKEAVPSASKVAFLLLRGTWELSASGKPIPTILITAYPDDGFRERVLATGVICYLSKPSEEDDLLVCIRAALTHARG